MTEKKTFKNAYISNEIRGDYHLGDMNWRIHQSEGFGETYGVFSSDEWDMEVTFTKKAKPPKVGDKALSPSGISECEIAAIDGDEVWLRYLDGSHSTLDLDKLIYAS